MGNSIEDIYQEGREDGLIEGREEGAHKACVSMARRMLANGFDREVIIKCSGLSAEEIGQLVREGNAEYKTEPAD